MYESLSNTKLNVLFFTKKTKLLKNGEAPICMRITVDSERTEIMIKRSVLPNKWNQAKECATANNAAAREVNHFIEVYQTKVFKIFRQMEMDGREITARTIAYIMQGREDPDKPKTLIDIFSEHNTQVHSLIGVDYAEVTAKKFDTYLLRLKEYLASEYRTEDMPISSVDNLFVRNYDLFLKTQCGCHHNSAIKHLKNLKKIVRIAMANGWVQKDPFFGIKFIEQETHVEFLTKEELATLINTEFTIPQHNQVRDIFVFCTFTGLAFADVKTLKPEHIKEDNDGQLWIRKPRQKTGVMCNIPLIPQAVKLIEKYKNHPHCVVREVVLPVFSNICMNDYLRDIARLCNFNKPLTCHIARHTAATVVFLANKVSMENVAKILGHKNTKMTQRYAKVLDGSIKRDMENVIKAMDF
ncbi:site-specific integrase [Dysgonomonas sp. Marseille-P4677]|uniref:site-specific integrase n=1 Tax=Dysgonomonas sp. Marseille-P4677 TaxID=2364790 RepID=UPI0019115814|nr:site-specific integrase [Dysgonomonas sp. Marseille-P4677]MBK5722175.1 site-specific integrase [Dysgonomonas sp. Marseille-P4677]